MLTGRQLKSQILSYLLRTGWKLVRPGEYYAWKDTADESIDPDRYCWHAAFLLQLSREYPQQVPSDIIPESGRRPPAA